MHALKVFRSPVWLLLHKLSSPHYRYIRKMRRGDRLPLTQPIITHVTLVYIGVIFLSHELIITCIFIHVRVCLFLYSAHIEHSH